MIWTAKFSIAVAVALGTFAAGSALYAFNTGKRAGASEVRAEWDAERLRTAEAIAAEIERTRTIESDLRRRIDRLRRANREDLDRLAADRGALLDGLRDRPEGRAPGPSGLPGDPGPGVGCTGAGLSRRDAEFLVGLAADAARAQAAARACEVAYEAARRALRPPAPSGGE